MDALHACPCRWICLWYGVSWDGHSSYSTDLKDSSSFGLFIGTFLSISLKFIDHVWHDVQKLTHWTTGGI